MIFGLFFLLTACEVSNPLVLPTDTPLPVTTTPSPTATPAPAPDTVPGFIEFLTQAESIQPLQRQELANRYTAQLAEAPVTSDDQAVFLWSGAANSVMVVGDMNNWDPAAGLMLARLEGTDLWYLVVEFESDARLDYQYLVDGELQGLDPLNPNSIKTNVGPSSVLVMPEYVMPPELLATGDDISRGTLTSHTFESNSLNQTRTYFVYEPAGQIVGRQLPTIYINNGSEYLNQIDTPAILDRLITLRIIPPLIAVFIPPINATQDYVLEDAYVSFLADELVPVIQQSYDADPDPAATGIMGSSLGGLSAVYTAFTRPDVFGLAASQSGSFGADNNDLIRQINRSQAKMTNGEAVRYYLVAGSYETASEGDVELESILTANRRLAAALEAINQDVQYEERPEGHSWGLWQGTIGRALAYLYSNSG